LDFPAGGISTVPGQTPNVKVRNRVGSEDGILEEDTHIPDFNSILMAGPPIWA
jgi:hypothetical protein